MNRLLLLFALLITLSTLHAQTADSTLARTDRTGVRTDHTGIKTDRTGAKTDSTGTKPEPAKVSPAIRSARQLTAFTKKLMLTEDQVILLRPILLNQAALLDSLQNHPSGDKHSDMVFRRSVIQDTEEKINNLLTDQQKQLYEEWKEEQREQALENQLNREAAQSQSN
jgi:hypothetical protein